MVTDNAAYVRAVHDKGLGFDLRTMSRRRMLGVSGGLGVAVLLGAPFAVARRAEAAELAACLEEIESETNGPYPADGTNGIDIRTTTGIVRTDIRSSFGSSSTVASGIPLTINFVIQDLNCAPLAGAAVYVWHCDQSGNYSLYSQGITNENYLRGIAETDSSGSVSFTSIFPACYAGRWPHVHFEVYESVAAATSGSGVILKTSQMALPEDVLEEVYATTGYSQSVTNLTQVTLATDNVFGDDDAAREMATLTGSVTDGFSATLTATIDPSGSESSGGAPSSQTGSPPSGTDAPPSGSAMPTGQPPTSGTATPTSTSAPTSSTTPTSTTPTSTTPASATPSSTTPTSTSSGPSMTSTAAPGSTTTRPPTRRVHPRRRQPWVQSWNAVWRWLGR